MSNLRHELFEKLSKFFYQYFLTKSHKKELLHQKQFFIVLDKLLWNNISRLRSSIALFNIVTNFLTFLKTLKTVSFNWWKVYEYISIWTSDKPKALISIKPFYSTILHIYILLGIKPK